MFVSVVIKLSDSILQGKSKSWKLNNFIIIILLSKLFTDIILLSIIHDCEILYASKIEENYTRGDQDSLEFLGYFTT